MSVSLNLRKRIGVFNKVITVSGDKSLSIRWILLSSLADGISKAKNLLVSEDVEAAVRAIRQLGIKVKLGKQICKVYGKGINGYKYKKNITINAQNSGTLGRLMLGLLINTPYSILVNNRSSMPELYKNVNKILKIDCSPDCKEITFEEIINPML